MKIRSFLLLLAPPAPDVCFSNAFPRVLGLHFLCFSWNFMRNQRFLRNCWISLKVADSAATPCSPSGGPGGGMIRILPEPPCFISVILALFATSVPWGPQNLAASKWVNFPPFSQEITIFHGKLAFRAWNSVPGALGGAPCPKPMFYQCFSNDFGRHLWWFSLFSA